MLSGPSRHLPWPLYQLPEVYVTNQTLNVMEILEVTQGHTVSGWWNKSLNWDLFHCQGHSLPTWHNCFPPKPLPLHATPVLNSMDTLEHISMVLAPGALFLPFLPWAALGACTHTHRAFFVYAAEAGLSSLGSDTTSCEQCCVALVLAPVLVHAEPPWHSASLSGGYSAFHTMLCILPVHVSAFEVKNLVSGPSPEPGTYGPC